MKVAEDGSGAHSVPIKLSQYWKLVILIQIHLD